MKQQALNTILKTDLVPVWRCRFCNHEYEFRPVLCKGCLANRREDFNHVVITRLVVAK